MRTGFQQCIVVLVIVLLHLQNIEVLLLLVEVLFLLVCSVRLWVFPLLGGSRLHAMGIDNVYYNDSYVNYDSALLEQCYFGLGVAVQLVDAVALQRDALQESVQFREAEDSVQGDLLELVVGQQQRVHPCAEHVVQDLVELLVLQPGADELDDLDGLPVEFVEEGLQVDLLEVRVEELDGVAADVGVVEGLLSPHCLHPLYVLVLLPLAADDRPLAHLHLPLASLGLELVLLEEVHLVLLLGQQQELLLNGVAVGTVDELLLVIAALETADQVLELVAGSLLSLIRQ